MKRLMIFLFNSWKVRWCLIIKRIYFNNRTEDDIKNDLNIRLDNKFNDKQSFTTPHSLIEDY